MKATRRGVESAPTDGCSSRHLVSGVRGRQKGTYLTSVGSGHDQGGDLCICCQNDEA